MYIPCAFSTKYNWILTSQIPRKGASTMKVTLDHEGCIGCGLCVSTCPAVFGLAADGKAEVVQTPISEEEKDGARLSAENCPVSVIEAEE